MENCQIVGSSNEINEQMRAVLGKGYDVTKRFAYSPDIKMPVLDIDSMVSAGLVTLDKNFRVGEVEDTSGSDASKYQEKFNQKIAVSAKGSVLGKGSFSAEARTTFGSERTQTNQYMFSTLCEVTQSLAYFIRVEHVIESSNIFLVPEFLTDLKSLSPKQIIDKYGTHVMLGGTFGGRFEYHLSTKNTGSKSSSNLSIYASAKASASFVGFKAQASAKSETQIERECSYDSSSTSVKTRAVGGEPQFANDMSNKDSYSKWHNTIKGNEVWVDYYQNSLVMLSELAPDDKTKQPLEEAIEAHIKANEITVSKKIKDGKLIIPQKTIATEAKKLNIKGDDDIWSKDGHATKWVLEIDLSLKNYNTDREGYDRLVADFIYTVHEQKSDWTIMEMKHTEEYDIRGKKIISLEKSHERLTGEVWGKNHIYNHVPFGFVVGRENDSFITALEVKIDGPGGDKKNLGFKPTFAIKVTEV